VTGRRVLCMTIQDDYLLRFEIKLLFLSKCYTFRHDWIIIRLIKIYNRSVMGVKLGRSHRGRNVGLGRLRIEC